MSDDLQTPSAMTTPDAGVEAVAPSESGTAPEVVVPPAEPAVVGSDALAEVVVPPTESAEPVTSTVAPPAEPAPPAKSVVAHPRSPHKRLQAQQFAAKGIRSQPLPPASPQQHTAPEPLPEPILPRGPWRWRWPMIGVALLVWVGAWLLLTTNLSSVLSSIGSPRRVFVLVWGLAALLTFAPVQWRLALSGLAWQGVFGWTLLGFLLAWAPPPTGNILSLPDLPGYLLLFLAVFYATTSAVTPLAFLLGQRVFSQRLQRLDARRARRQGYEAGLLAVTVLVLANLSVLLWWTALLLVIVIVLLETLFLSQVRPEG